jgi:hypothetical protein
VEDFTSRRFIMSESNPSFFSRVIGSEVLKKGAATVVTSILVAIVSEALWPSTER